jgi:hypothetical protein
LLFQVFADGRKVEVELAGVVVAGAVEFCVDRVSHETLRARLGAWIRMG